MALNNFKCNHTMRLHFKGLKVTCRHLWTQISSSPLAPTLAAISVKFVFLSKIDGGAQDICAPASSPFYFKVETLKFKLNIYNIKIFDVYTKVTLVRLGTNWSHILQQHIYGVQLASSGRGREGGNVIANWTSHILNTRSGFMLDQTPLIIRPTQLSQFSGNLSGCTGMSV